MQEPLITIAIPTRERAETLAYALKTLTSQAADDCEFLVSDNASADATREVVSSIKDPRVRYVRLHSRGSMSSNYDFALSHARGRYISFLGDDDGFTPGSLEYLSQLCRRHGPHAVSWSEGSFRWPGVHGAGPAQRLFFNDRLFRVKTSAVRPLWQLGMLRWGFCPIIYGGLVKTDVLNSLRGKDGKFFQSEIPDVYSSAVLMDGLKEYLYVDSSLSVFGYSKKSNAAAYFSRNTGGANDALSQFKSEFERPTHRKFSAVTLKSDHAAVYECLLRANDLKHRAGAFWLDAFWYLRIARSLSMREDPYRSHALAELSRTAPRRYLKALVDLYARKEPTEASAAVAEVSAEQSPHPTINDLCEAAGRYAQKHGIVRSQEPTATVATIFDGISYRKYVQSRMTVVNLCPEASGNLAAETGR